MNDTPPKLGGANDQHPPYDCIMNENMNDETTYALNALDATDDATLDAATLATIRDLHAHIALDIAHIAANDYSDDDTDYFPARAATLSNLISFMTSRIDSPLRDSYRAALTNDDSYFLTDLSACDADLPIDFLIDPLD